MEHKAGFLDDKPSNNSMAFVQDPHIGPKQTLYRRTLFECFAASYVGKSIDLSLFEELEKRDYHKPPNSTVLLGRQRERSILSQGENAGRSKRIRCCSKCKRPGHNKQTWSE